MYLGEINCEIILLTRFYEVNLKEPKIQQIVSTK